VFIFPILILDTANQQGWRCGALGSKRSKETARNVDPADRDDAHVPGQRGIRMIVEIDVRNCMCGSLTALPANACARDARVQCW
jgi:hypothetical protein